MPAQVLSQTFGRPGQPGAVDVIYLAELRKGSVFEVVLLTPGEGGKGGPALREPEPGDVPFVHRGGAGGGRENAPIVEALRAYAESLNESENPPFVFLEAGSHMVEWPYDIPTATIVIISPGGGGGGGWGEVFTGQDGENGVPGAAFVFPTHVPPQRPSHQEQTDVSERLPIVVEPQEGEEVRIPLKLDDVPDNAEIKVVIGENGEDSYMEYERSDGSIRRLLTVKGGGPISIGTLRE